MSKTETQLAQQVLEDMSIIPAGGVPTAADNEYVIRVYNDKIEDWRDESLVYWVAGEIPQSIFRTLCALVANEIAPAFGKTSSLEERMQRETMLLRRLRRHMARKPSGFPTKAVYY